MWFIFTILTTLIWGLAELFYKKGAHEREPYAHLKISICVGAVMGIHAIATILLSGMDYNFKNILIYLPVSLCYIISMTLSYFGMRFIEESISDPIENTSGALCSILCVIFLGDSIAKGSWISIVLIVIGILGVGFLENSGSTDRKKKIGKTMAVVAFAMPFCYAILDALGSFLDAFYLTYQDEETLEIVTPLLNVTEDTIENVANTSYELTFLIFAIILYIFLKIKKVKFDLPIELKKKENSNMLVAQWDKILAAVCETAGQFTYVYAMSDKAEIAAPIISSGCVVSVLLSRIFLKEKLTFKQYIFIAFVIIGIILLGVLNPDV